MLMEIWMRAHLTSNDKKMVYYIKLIVNFLIMSSDFGEINLHIHSIQRTIFLSGQGNLLRGIDKRGSNFGAKFVDT